MKNFLVTIFLLMSVSSVFAFYSNDKEHEISVGYGRFSFLHLGNTFFNFGSEDGLWYVDEDKSFYGTVNVSYLHQTEKKRLKFGAMFTYEGYKNIKTPCSVPGWLYHWTSYYEIKGGDLSPSMIEKIEKEKEEVEHFKRIAEEMSGVERINVFTFEPIWKLTIARTEKFAFYQRYGLGLSVKIDKDVDERKCSAFPAFTISPACFEFGNDRLRGFVEVLSFSFQGVFNGGLVYQF